MRLSAPFDLPKPYDIDIEQQLLGQLLMNNDAVERLIGFLEPEHFAEPMHQRIYKAIEGAVRGGHAATPFTLKPEFEHDEAMRDVGGPAYLAELAISAHNCFDPGKWASALHALAFRRRLIAAARDIQDTALKAPIEVDAERMADVAEQMMAEAVGASSPASAARFHLAGSIAAGVIDEVTGPTPPRCVLFGVKGLDDLTGGCHAKEFIIVGARPGMGKTAFAGHVALAAALQGKTVAFFSMEMAAAAVTLRLAAAQAFADGAHVAYDAARRGALSADHAQALIAAQARLATLPLYVHEGRGLTPSALLLAAKRLQNRMKREAAPLGLVVIDHIQKIRPDRDHRANKVAEMTEISDALQRLAGALDVPVVALSQLNRAVEGRADRKPELSDLRESGAIEQDADVVLLLFREAYYVKKREPHALAPEWRDWQAEWLRCQHTLEIHIAKHRNGQEGHVRAHFDGPSSGIRDW